MICRAYFKVEELFETHLRDETAALFAAQPKAIDVGAAPGGWTDYMRTRCAMVYAVDPGELHWTLKNAAGVRHLQMGIERAHTRLRADAPFDVLLCDMNLSDQEAIGMVLPLAEFLRPGAWLVFTLKYCGRGCKPANVEIAVRRLIRALGGTVAEPVEGDACVSSSSRSSSSCSTSSPSSSLVPSTISEAISAAPLFDEFRWFWLWANSERERTIVARRTAHVVAAPSADAQASAVDEPARAPRSVSTWGVSAVGFNDHADVALSDALIHAADEKQFGGQ